MNCNKCGTPILPGENICRFCGTIGDYSKRKEEFQPEIIDFTAGNDDVVIIDNKVDDRPVVPSFKPVDTNINPMTNTTQTISALKENIVEKEVNPVAEIPVVQPQVSNTEVAQSISETPIIIKETPTVNTAVPPVVSQISDIPETISKTMEMPKINMNSQVEEPSVKPIEPLGVPSIPSGPSEVSQAEPVIVETFDNKDNQEELTNIPEGKEEIPEKVETPKEKQNHGLFNILTFVLIILLICSIVLNCFLLMGDANVQAEELPAISSTNQTVYFSGYKAEMPSNWINTINGSNNYLILMDSTEEWSATINVATGVSQSDIETTENIANITTSFGNNKYLFTSDYAKTVNGKDYHVFKGKYSLYTVYVATTSLNDNSVVVAELKFKGEVDEAIVESVMTTMSTVTTYDLSAFFSEDFGYPNIAPILSDSVVKNTVEVEGNN